MHTKEKRSRYVVLSFVISLLIFLQKVADCGCSVDVLLFEFFLVKTFKMAPPYTSFPLMPYDARDSITFATMELLGITSPQEIFNSSGTGWYDPQHQETLKKRRLASLMVDLKVKGQEEDIKDKEGESPGPLDDIATSSSTPVRHGGSSSSRSMRSLLPTAKTPSLTPIQKKLRSAKTKGKLKAS